MIFNNDHIHITLAVHAYGSYFHAGCLANMTAMLHYIGNQLCINYFLMKEMKNILNNDYRNPH